MGLVMALNVTRNAFRVTSNTIDRASAKRGLMGNIQQRSTSE